MFQLGPYDDIFKDEDGNYNYGDPFIRLEIFFTSLIFVIEDATFIYQIFYVTFAYLGFFGQKIFYVFHLFDVINHYPVLESVTGALEYSKT